MKRAYYNEHDPKAAAWLRALIAERLIADGEVDERSIAAVRPDDLSGFRQCHFFAGIGGWSYALRLAGWPDDRDVWTGSCPCQPFSAAGKGDGFADERHLWPAFYWLIKECKPHVVFGEQVESPAGRAWLDLVSTDLEAADYAIGPSDLPAASIGAPHIRQRLFWVAERDGLGFHSGRVHRSDQEDERRQARCATAGHLEHERLADESSRGQRVDGSTPRQPGLTDERGTRGGLVNGLIARLERHSGDGDGGVESRRLDAGASRSIAASGATRGTWADVDWLYCRDGKFRPVEPGTFPLGYGLPARVGRLRGYGNAIVPQIAAEFIGAYLDLDRRVA